MMQITFDFDANDWMQFQRHHERHSVAGILMYSILAIFVVFLILFGISVITTGDSLLNCMPLLILTIIYFFLVRGRTGKWAAKRLEKKEKNNPQVFGQRTMTFDEDFFTIQTDNSHGKLKWNIIKKLQETPDYFFLYTSGFMAYVIPKKKIGIDAQDLQDFLKKHIAQENYKFYKK